MLLGTQIQTLSREMTDNVFIINGNLYNTSLYSCCRMYHNGLEAADEEHTRISNSYYTNITAIPSMKSMEFLGEAERIKKSSVGYQLEQRFSTLWSIQHSLFSYSTAQHYIQAPQTCF